MTNNSAGDPQKNEFSTIPAPTSIDVNRVTLDDPWIWLAAGWRDLLKAPAIGLSYGALFLAGGWLLTVVLQAADMWFLLLPMAAGFMLIGPIVAVGLYEVSRAHELGETPSLAAALSAWRREAGQLGMMCVVLVILHLVWVLVAIVIFALFLGDNGPTLENLIGDVFFQPESVPFLVVGTAAGAILAVLVFSVSAVSIPMIVDRQTDAITAILTSLKAVQQNWQAMFLWAGLIVVFTAAGIATLFIGLAITLPLIGFATWHAYRALVK